MPALLSGGSVQGAVAVVNLLLVGAIAYSAAPLVWLVTPSTEPSPQMALLPLVSAESQTDGGAVRREQTLASVARLHLFGQADSAPMAASKPVRPPPQEAPETRLNLTLRGVIASSDPRSALAFIARGGSQEELFKVGDQVDAGAVVHEIHPDRVILTRGGRLETLRLPKESLVNSAPPARVGVATGGGIGPSPRANPSQGYNRQPPPGVSPGSGNRGGGSGAHHLTDRRVAEELGRVREKIMQNPMEVGQIAGVQPVMEGGEMRGYRLNPGTNRRLFFQTGLRSGDLVTKVNGTPLTSAANLPRVMQMLSTESQFEVHVERNGVPNVFLIDVGGR